MRRCQLIKHEEKLYETYFITVDTAGKYCHLITWKKKHLHNNTLPSLSCLMYAPVPQYFRMDNSAIHGYQLPDYV